LLGKSKNWFTFIPCLYADNSRNFFHIAIDKDYKPFIQNSISPETWLEMLLHGSSTPQICPSNNSPNVLSDFISILKRP
jgi:hypothetical protein